MSIYIDADAIVRWEKGELDLPGWLTAQGDELMAIPATVWQQIQFGAFAWMSDRAAKRRRYLEALANLPVAPFSRRHAERAATLAAELRLEQIGFADFQIAATALEDGVKLLTCNVAHFKRVPGLSLAKA
jgi:predicted nucleic acid-binding protein